MISPFSHCSVLMSVSYYFQQLHPFLNIYFNHSILQSLLLTFSIPLFITTVPTISFFHLNLLHSTDLLLFFTLIFISLTTCMGCYDLSSQSLLCINLQFTSPLHFSFYTLLIWKMSQTYLSLTLYLFYACIRATQSGWRKAHSRNDGCYFFFFF